MGDVGMPDGRQRFLSDEHKFVLSGAATYAALAALVVTVGHLVNGPAFMPLNGIFVASAVLVAVIAAAFLVYRRIVL